MGTLGKAALATALAGLALWAFCKRMDYIDRHG